MSKKLTQNEKATLGVMWTLLNTTTKYNWDIENVIEVMKIIRKTYPHADKMWVKEFKILVGGDVVFSWKDGEVLSQ